MSYIKNNVEIVSVICDTCGSEIPDYGCGYELKNNKHICIYCKSKQTDNKGADY